MIVNVVLAVRLIKYMMYVPVPQKLIFFRKIPRSVSESLFTGQIYFHWPNLFSLVKYIL